MSRLFPLILIEKVAYDKVAYDKDHMSALRIKPTSESDPRSYEVT